jgi:hypothetical protein
LKKIIIISTYPDTDGKINTLDECVDSLSGFGYDLMIVSHLPVPEYITKKVQYFLYDSQNILVPTELSPFSWTSNDTFSAKLYCKYHSLAILTNISNSLNFAKFKEYEFFYFLESDNIFSFDDRDKLENLRNEMEKQEKKMIFFSCAFNEDGIPYDLVNKNTHIYETLIFGGYVDYFLDIYKIPKNIEEYIEHFTNDMLTINQMTLERHFYYTLNKYDTNFLIVSDFCIDYFGKSVINKYSRSLNCKIIKSENDGKLLLFISNFVAEKYIVEINSRAIDIYPGVWFYDIFNYDIEVKVYKEGSHICDEYLFIYEDFISGKEEIMGTIEFY